MRCSVLLILLSASAICSRAQTECSTTANQLPAVRGMKLQMSKDDFRRLLIPAAPKVMDLNLLFGHHFSNSAALEGVSMVRTEFFNGHLSYIELSYNNSIRWESDREFAETIGESLKLPTSGWKKGLSGYKIQCADFSVLARTNHVTLTDDRASKAQEDNEKAEAEKKKRAFKP